jgi:hypothetical protein
MTLNRLLTTLMQVGFSLATAVVFALIIRDLLHERRIAHYERTRVSWVFPPHSEAQRLAAAQRLFDSDVYSVNTELDDVQTNVNSVNNRKNGVQ